jgi:hypothetical protein
MSQDLMTSTSAQVKKQVELCHSIHNSVCVISWQTLAIAHPLALAPALAGEREGEGEGEAAEEKAKEKERRSQKAKELQVQQNQPRRS